MDDVKVEAPIEPVQEVVREPVTAAMVEAQGLVVGNGATWPENLEAPPGYKLLGGRIYRRRGRMPGTKVAWKARSKRVLLSSGKTVTEGLVERREKEQGPVGLLDVSKETQWESLTPDDRMYVEERLKGLPPIDAARAVSEWNHEAGVTLRQMSTRALYCEKRLKPILRGLRRAESMTDVEYDAWEERQVRQLAETSETSSRIEALKFLRIRRAERKAGDTEKLVEMIFKNAEQMNEMSAIACMGSVSARVTDGVK